MEHLGRVLELLNFQAWPNTDWKWPLLQAHRGHWIVGPRENSLKALAEAKRFGFKLAEVDVRLSKDHVPVLAHDKDLNRLNEKDVKVADLTVKELSRFEYPSLQEVLQSQDRPAHLNLEIKNDHRLDTLLESQILEVIKGSDCQEQILVSSFNPLSLAYFAKKAPQIPRALLIEMDQFQKISYWRMIGNIAAQAHMINWPYQLLTEGFVKKLKDAGLPVVAWTVNDYKIARELLSWGVDSIVTDRMQPQQLEEFLKT